MGNQVQVSFMREEYFLVSLANKELLFDILKACYLAVEK